MEGIKPFIGLIGAGYWGKNILRNLCELGVLRTLCDTDQTLLDEYRQQYKTITVTTFFKDILKDKSIKTVTIATPASTHYELAKAAVEAEKEVPDHALVMGISATQVGWVCRCGTTLALNNNNARCDYCNTEYRLVAENLEETRDF
jgi:hypothetical protein